MEHLYFILLGASAVPNIKPFLEATSKGVAEVLVEVTDRSN